MSPRKIFAVVVASALGLTMIYLGMSSRPQEPEKTFSKSEVPPAWRADVLDAVELMPLADTDGRVKSLNTFAYYELLRTRAYASMSLKVEGEKKKRSWTPAAWMLDCLFYPELANHYPVFIVEDGEVLSQLGLSPHGKQRDRYSFNELKPGRAAIMAAYERLSDLDSEKLDRVERLTLSVAQNFMAYESLIGLLDAARQKVKIPADVPEAGLKEWAGKEIASIHALALLAKGETWAGLKKSRTEASPPQPPEWFMAVLTQIEKNLSGPTRSLRWFAPTEKGKDNWEATTGLVNDLVREGPHAPTAGARLIEISELVELASQPEKNTEFQDKLKAFAATRTEDAKAVGAYGKINHDRNYLKLDLFFWTKWGFILLFLMAAVSWLIPQAKGYQKVLSGIAWLGFAAILTNIFYRVWITGWGPVTNIYETIPYITVMAGIFALLMQRAMKNQIPLALAIAIGAGGLFMAEGYEGMKAHDTIDALTAVLRSNYWLWTHVTTINLGYATVLLAAIFSTVYIFARVFDVMRTDTKLCRDLTRSAYGILCFGLFFALIGTILGGIWGNESWGRFWGWDPKENGALLIVLWCLLVMHMRLAGWIKEFGFHIWCAMGALPTIFSWWHVNLLGVGLHSYGFTEGLQGKLNIAYCIVAGIVILGISLRIMEAVARRQMAQMKDSDRNSPLPQGATEPG